MIEMFHIFVILDQSINQSILKCNDFKDCFEFENTNLEF